MVFLLQGVLLVKEEGENLSLIKKFFHYGYTEIKCKAADASITRSFWTTCQNSELNILEFMSVPTQEWKRHLEKEYKLPIHDRTPGQGGKLPDRINTSYLGELLIILMCTAEWDEVYLKFYAEEELNKSVTKTELGDGGVLNNPLWILVDSETFSWHGIPVKEDLPVNFENEYICIWQK